MPRFKQQVSQEEYNKLNPWLMTFVEKVVKNVHKHDLALQEAWLAYLGRKNIEQHLRKWQSRNWNKVI